MYPKAKVVMVSNSPTRKDKAGKWQRFSYAEVKYDDDGIANPEEFLPEPFDLVRLITDKNKSRSGWWTGSKWECRKLQDDEKVLFWKKVTQGMENGEEVDTKSDKKPWGFKSIFEDTEREGHFIF